MSLATPEKIRSLQRKLYRKAKAEPAFRFYVLYDKICREDILRHAYGLARDNAGAPGVDGVNFAQIEEQGLEAWLASLREDLVAKTYRPDPVRRVMIPKPDGGERPLGIPTIRDRVVQTAAKLVLEPIFEADFEDSAYGYRPARGAAYAVKDVCRHLCQGYTDVVDADLSRYFDSIPHDDLLKSVARRVADGGASADQAVAEGADRGAGRQREAADRRRQGQQARHAARRRREPTARQHLHEPVPEALASDRVWRSIPCSRRRLCRRLRHPQPRLCGRGTGVDEGGDDEARVDNQRGQDLVERCPAERFDFLGYSFGPLSLQLGRSQVHECEPLEEERATAQDEGARAADARQQLALARGARHLNRSLRGWSSYFCLERVGRLSAASITMSASACAPSLPDGTKWQGAVTVGSHGMRSIATTVCCVWNACPDLLRCGRCGEASRRAGYRKPVSPVR